MNALERETTIVLSDGDPLVQFWSARRQDIRRLRKNPRVTEVSSGMYEGTEWASFTVPVADWNPVSGVKRTVNMTPEQRAAAAARLAATRGRQTF